MVRTRYAPSPTGFMHIGNLRTALYEYLIAKAAGGVFVLRIEDTDRERYVPGAEDAIFDTLQIHGLNFDEGPGVGGEYGPYVQSERKDGYMPHAKKLIENGSAYLCFCDKERLDSLKDESGYKKYDRACQKISDGERASMLSGGAPYVVRQYIPEGRTVFFDEVYGEISMENSEMEDQVLIKSDGMPTYNFANVIDDNAMKITHVVRGSEYLTSTPKYKLLYDALGFTVPKFIHLPLLQNHMGQKISKRHGDASVLELIGKGFLPEAILNYAALLGWSPGGSKEIFSLSELVEEFRCTGISKSPSTFDIKKLTWVNCEHIKLMTDEAFFEKAKPNIMEAVKTPGVDYRKLAANVKSRISFLHEINSLLDFIDALPPYDIGLFYHKKMKTDPDIAKKALTLVYDALVELETFTHESVMTALAETATSNGLTKGQVLWSVRTAASGKPETPCGAAEICEILGKTETLKRIKHGLEKLM